MAEYLLSQWIAGRTFTGALEDIIADITTAGGNSRIFIDLQGELPLTSAITLPRYGPGGSAMDSLLIEGLGREITAIKWQGPAGVPMLQWVASSGTSGKSVNNVVIRDLTLRRSDSGTVLKYRGLKWIENGQPQFETLSDSRFENLRLAQAHSGTAPTVDMEKLRFTTFRDIRIEGGSAIESGKRGTGFLLSGSHLLLENIYSPQEVDAPAVFIDLEASNSRIVRCRTEGGGALPNTTSPTHFVAQMAPADYYIHDCSAVHLEDLHGEGNLALDGIRLEHVRGATIVSCGLPTPNFADGLPLGMTHAVFAKVRAGLHFVDTSQCTVIGGVATAHDRINGYAVAFDAASASNKIDGLRITATSGAAEPTKLIADEGVKNRWWIVENGVDPNDPYYGVALVRPCAQECSH